MTRRGRCPGRGLGAVAGNSRGSVGTPGLRRAGARPCAVMPECQVLSLYPEQCGHRGVVTIPCPHDPFCRVSGSLPSLWSGVKPAETMHSKAGWPGVSRQVFESLGICSLVQR